MMDSFVNMREKESQVVESAQGSWYHSFFVNEFGLWQQQQCPIWPSKYNHTFLDCSLCKCLKRNVALHDKFQRKWTWCELHLWSFVLFRAAETKHSALVWYCSNMRAYGPALLSKSNCISHTPDVVWLWMGSQWNLGATCADLGFG